MNYTMYLKWVIKGENIQIKILIRKSAKARETRRKKFVADS